MIKCDPRPREGSTSGCWLYVVVADIFFFFLLSFSVVLLIYYLSFLFFFLGGVLAGKGKLLRMFGQKV